MTKIYAVNCYVKSKPYAGIPELLQHLSASGLPVAVLSNKPHQFTVEMVERYFPAVKFAAVEGVHEGGPRKPDPAAALKIADVMGLKTEEIGFVGDTRTDMATAVNSGMLPVGAAWGFRPRRELLDYGARVLLEQPLELPGIEVQPLPFYALNNRFKEFPCFNHCVPAKSLFANFNKSFCVNP